MTKKNATIIGYGSQGRAQALNLRDSGWNIEIVLPAYSSKITAVQTDEITLSQNPKLSVANSQFVIMLAPDLKHGTIWNQWLKDALPPHSALLFAHGYSVHYKELQPRADIDVILAAPMCPGPSLRKRYECGGVSAFITSIQNDASGTASARLKTFLLDVTKNQYDEIPSTFVEETETDLFSEQVLTCGGLTHLIMAAFDTLIEAGYNPKIAYYTCLQECRDLAELFANQGLAGAFAKISGVARYGALTRGPTVIDSNTKRAMHKALSQIRSGEFRLELAEANANNSEPTAPWRNHLIEQLHSEIFG